jgi:triosephosphate isomerase
MNLKLIVANWKMNLNPSEGGVLLHKLDEAVEPKEGVEIVICPPFIDLYPLAQTINRAKFKLGGQNIHYLDHGAFTGEISPNMLKDLADYVIVGHSERRLGAGEDDKLIAKKVSAAIRNNLIPVLCVGDTLSDREHKLAKKVIVDQLTADTAMLTAEEVGKLVVAYEPVWAIGTGNFAKPSDVEPIMGIIRHTLEELYGENIGTQVKVLYGGSVTTDNARAYLEMNGLDGLLVGGASLNYQQFAKIIQVAQSLSGPR